MNILLISQCDKRALVESRRILDQFAERCGDRSWQTPITQAGLDTLRKLLKKTARRNTAVACHWIRGLNHSELLWIVGDASRFNERGAVPTNTTGRDILRRDDENDWHTGEDIRLLAQMAALLHDLGKASVAFQAKLRQRQAVADAYRHEWVSLRLFEAFVGPSSNDADWLQRLACAEGSQDGDWLARLQRDDMPSRQPAAGAARFKKSVIQSGNPLRSGGMPPLAQVIGWLVVSHHRLPLGDLQRRDLPALPTPINAEWCGARNDASAQDKAACWQFTEGHLPFASRSWRQRIAECASGLLRHPGLLERAGQLLDNPWVLHLARLTLMLADHHYSSLPPSAGLGDAGFAAYANTDKGGQLKQRLDEHLLGVAREARRVAQVLPQLERRLPRLSPHRGFRKRSADRRFAWQDKAFDLACSLHQPSIRHGFFGINMASTGCGKTLANGRILYGLADPQRGPRFSIALGLRTLPLQTGQVYRERLGLGEDDLAVMVGGTAVRQLFEAAQTSAAAQSGSESAEALLADNLHVHYESALADGPLQRWLERNPAAHKLVSAPILACTIDHLMPASESLRGGHQIAPMLRLLTSDLVLDEVDDFDMADLPALARLVYWAGLLGSRVLLSSATLPPALVGGLFDAYCAGRRVYQANRGEPGTPLEICCAWFDEFACRQSRHSNRDSLLAAHGGFVDQRVQKLAGQAVRRQAQILPLTLESRRRPQLSQELVSHLLPAMLQLHQVHHTLAPDGRRVSCGLLRMANIEPLTEVAQALFALDAPESTRIHLCVYHSRHPLLLRSALERELDSLLSRHNPEALFAHPLVGDALAAYPEQDQLFVVLASPVAEVGRDHDYDWAIVEPSSSRSLIQLAGRIRRHRPEPVTSTNLLLLQYNLLALQGSKVAFTRPGFESEEARLVSHDLNQLIPSEQLLSINAMPRIRLQGELADWPHRLDLLEHTRLGGLLLEQGPLSSGNGIGPHVADWWAACAGQPSRLHLCAVLQKQTPFRAGRPDQPYILQLEEDDEDGALQFCRLEDDGTTRRLGNLLTQQELHCGQRMHPWACIDYRRELLALAERFELSPNQCARRFGQVQLAEAKDNSQGWEWHEVLGFRRR